MALFIASIALISQLIFGVSVVNRQAQRNGNANILLDTRSARYHHVTLASQQQRSLPHALSSRLPRIRAPRCAHTIACCASQRAVPHALTTQRGSARSSRHLCARHRRHRAASLLITARTLRTRISSRLYPYRLRISAARAWRHRTAYNK